MPISNYAKEFLVFMEQWRTDSYGHHGEIEQEWVDACHKAAEEEGREPLIEYFSDSFDYTEQIKKFFPYIRGDTLVETGKTAAEVLVEILVNSHSDVANYPVYSHFFLTIPPENIYNMFYRIIRRFTENTNDYTCVEDLFAENNVGVCCRLLVILDSVENGLIDKTFEHVPLLDDDALYKIYNVERSHLLTREQILAVLFRSINAIRA